MLFKNILLNFLFLNFLGPLPTSFSDVGEDMVTLSSLKNTADAQYYLEEESGLFLNQDLYITIRKGDTLSSVLRNAEIPGGDVDRIINAISFYYAPGQLKVGQEIFVKYNHRTEEPYNKVLLYLLLNVDHEKAVEVSLQQRDGENIYFSRLIERPLTKTYAYRSARINDSFYSTAKKLGLNLDAFFEVLQAYDYLIDFQRDIHPDTTFEVVYEAYYHEDGEFSHNGKIVYASFNINGSKIPVFLYPHGPSKMPQYFTDDGISAVKALLKNPVKRARISSHFGRRMHPILNYERKHQGIDFAAPHGTPIYSVGDGKITFMGKRGGYGNYIIVRHNNRHSSAYAHLSRFAQGLQVGQYVRQKQIIGHVGHTGSATGDHLHFEIIENGQRVNPAGIKTAPSIMLSGAELEKFKRFKTQILGVKDDQRIAVKETSNQDGDNSYVSPDGLYGTKDATRTLRN